MSRLLADPSVKLQGKAARAALLQTALQHATIFGGFYRIRATLDLV